MAIAPTPTAPHPAAAPAAQKPAAAAPAHKQDPAPSTTSATDQLQRSQQMEEMGMAKWAEENDDRKKPGYSHRLQVPGVSATSADGDDYEAPGTPTTPPEGHDDMNPAPGEPGGPSAGHYVDPNATSDDPKAGPTGGAPSKGATGQTGAATR